MRFLRPIALLSLASLLLVSSANASYDPLASGTAKLILDPGFRALLKQSQIKLVGRKGVRVIAQKSTVFPLKGGEADPTLEKGTFELAGELVLRTPRKAVPFTFLQVKTKPSPLYAKVGGGQQKVAKATRSSFVREGLGYGYVARGLRLSTKTATRLDKRLDTDVFQAGQPLGSLEVASQPQTVAVLPTGRASLVPDPAFLAKLKGLHVSLNPISPAELAPGPVLSFPIAVSGTIAPDAGSGTIHLGGAMELLQQGAGQVLWQEPWVELGGKVTSAEADIQPSPPYPGKQGRVSLFDLGAAQVSSDPVARTVSVSAPLALQASTAAALNEAIAERKEAFKAGEALGSLSFVAQGQ